MASLPPWIDTRIDDGLNKKLTQRHVVETMLEADRPYFSAEQIRARVRPDVSKETVRLRLNELLEIDVIAADTYPESITLYYINHPNSHWPLSPKEKTPWQTRHRSKHFRSVTFSACGIRPGSERWCSRAFS